MVYVVDRIEEGVAVCENLETGEKLELDAQKFLNGAKEGDVIRHGADGYVIDTDFTKQRKAELADRLNRLFEKHKGQ